MVTRVISEHRIRQAVIDAIGEIFCRPDPEVLEALIRASEQETEALPRDVLNTIIQNAEIAAREGIPICQDTGTLVVFAEIGNQVIIDGNPIRDIIESAAAEAWQQYYLRRSTVEEPLFDRMIESIKVPCVLHIDIVSGDKLRLRFALKGGGAENMSRHAMLQPGAGRDTILAFVLQTVLDAGGKACPPLIVGIGIGGNFERCAILSKQALMLPFYFRHPDPQYRKLEEEIITRINLEGCGAQGLGGSTTALAVHIISEPCHIASLPVAVNLDCHAHRSLGIEI
ncbi:MAG: fumarate hydratase [Candidatus Cloacimonadaceae bacterium]|nr:fumarate hydratase [Candidatus Cloacimonadaceae bacterium]MDP3114588.1 fumarate hydratase [Candidatus Cloacimonadaceae bacterium]